MNGVRAGVQARVEYSQVTKPAADKEVNSSENITHRKKK